jgi:hypothetical protein
MVDVGVGKVPLGAAKAPSRRGGGIGLTGPPFNRGGGVDSALPSPRKVANYCLGECALIFVNPQIFTADYPIHLLCSVTLCSYSSHLL